MPDLSSTLNPNDEIIASRLYHFLCRHLELIGCQYMLDRHHKTLKQADIASGDAQNRCNSLLVGESIGMGRHAIITASDVMQFFITSVAQCVAQKV